MWDLASDDSAKAKETQPLRCPAHQMHEWQFAVENSLNFLAMQGGFEKRTNCTDVVGRSYIHRICSTSSADMLSGISQWPYPMDASDGGVAVIRRRPQSSGAKKNVRVHGMRYSISIFKEGVANTLNLRGCLRNPR